MARGVVMAIKSVIFGGFSVHLAISRAAVDAVIRLPTAGGICSRLGPEYVEDNPLYSGRAVQEIFHRTNGNLRRLFPGKRKTPVEIQQKATPRHPLFSASFSRIRNRRPAARSRAR
jgi:hypothetical protein